MKLTRKHSDEILAENRAVAFSAELNGTVLKYNYGVSAFSPLNEAVAILPLAENMSKMC